MKKILIFVFLVLIIASIANAAIPVINSYVTDTAGVLSSENKAALEKTLTDFEKVTNGVQFVVYIEDEYDKSYSFEEYTLKIAEENKIGKKGNDNGLLLYVAIKDRQFRWEVGYGVESTLSAPLLGRISDEYLIPSFKEGNYETGILNSVDVAGRILLNSQDEDIIKLKQDAVNESKIPKFLKSPFFWFLAIFLISSIVQSLARKGSGVKRSYNDSFYTGAATGLFLGRGRGGFGGGGFGGFSGGGGGFGGGGFSGRF
ncbi:MAG TPA: TPM domain-containing protein [Candidatus Nanoarchaeia archaeon]|nr:TPM domain-containing protein [Candidatus Nanoarchaeia archaeon]